MVLGRGGGVSAGINPEVPGAVETYGRQSGPEPNRGRAGPGRDPSPPRDTNPGTALSAARTGSACQTVTPGGRGGFAGRHLAAGRVPDLNRRVGPAGVASGAAPPRALSE